MNRKAQTMLDAFRVLPAGAVIVEIGCIRFSHEVPSDGYSTVHLARAAEEHGWKVMSVDINPDAVTRARAATACLPIKVHQGDGEQFLRSLPHAIDGLYLDGSADPEEARSQYFAAVLNARAVVCIDDLQAIDGREGGKGGLLLEQLRMDGFDVQVRATEPGYLMAVAHREPVWHHEEAA